jgi:hypothetical protein
MVVESAAQRLNYSLQDIERGDFAVGVGQRTADQRIAV